MGATTDRYPVSIAGDQPDLVDGNPKPLVYQLRKGRFVALPLRCDSDHQIDEAVRQYRDFCALPGNARCRVHVVADSDAATFASGTRLSLSAWKASPVGEGEC